MKNFHKISESLIEIIVAISIIGVGAVASLTIISMSVRGNIANKDRLVAINLAREGIEVFENIRDTNLKNAKYEAEPKCWRAIDIDSCSSTSLDQLWGKSEDGSYIDYIVSLEPTTMKWTIIKIDDLIDADISSGPSDQFQLYKTEDNFLTNVESLEPTNFYRAIRVEEITKDELAINEFDLDTYFTQGDVLKIRSIVYFKNRDGWSKVEIASIITTGVENN